MYGQMRRNNPISRSNPPLIPYMSRMGGGGGGLQLPLIGALGTEFILNHTFQCERYTFPSLDMDSWKF